MARQILHTGVIAFSTILMVGASLAHADTPVTPERPGRATTEETTPTDEQLLQKTAAGLEVPSTQPLDAQILDVFGLRSKLADEGYTFSGSWTLDDSQNLRGGLDTNENIFRNLFDLRMNIDTKPVFGFEGGTFSIDFQNQAGRNGTDDLGDVQGYDNIDADGRTQLSEVWYEQKLFEDKLRIKVGKVDSNTEFGAPKNGSSFINSSFGHSPTILDMPTYPDPATSINVFVYPTPQTYAGIGVYDGSGQEGVATGSYGPARLNHGNRDFFYIAEAGYLWQLKDDTLPGRVAVGAHYLDGDFDKFDGGTESGAGGFYVNVDQKLWHKNFYDKTNANGVYSFLQYGHTNKDVSDVTDYFGAGVTWVGPYDKDNPDTVGLGVAAAKLTNEDGAGFTKDYETSVEAFYNYQATSYLSIKPDLQYIFNPGGDKTLDNALVATIRVTLAF